MNAHTNITTPALVYKGEAIAIKNDTLSLTDMWKAAQADESKRPSEWLRHDATKEFVEIVAASNMGGAHISTRRGVNGGTYAHWQIGLAYAKYLSPEFHMWCNQVVRERMEGKSVATANLSPDVLEMIRRDDGISRMLAHKVTGIEASVQTLAMAIAAIASVVQPSHPGLYVTGKTSGEIWREAGLPPRLKNAPRWLGNRLAEMGCQMDDCRMARIGLSSARVFDPDKASACLKNGLLHKAKVYASERMGQSSLRLVGRA